LHRRVAHPATNLAKVLTPGNSTRRSRSQVTAPSNNAFGPSPPVHALSATHRTSSSCIPANSTNP